MTDVQDWLDKGREIESKATDGPWGGTWNGAREGSIGGDTDVLDATNVSAQDLHFITEARTRLPQALAALQAVLDEHEDIGLGYCRECDRGWPCRTVRAITDAIGDNDD